MWKAVMFSSCDLLFIILFRKPNLNHQFVLLRVEKSLKKNHKSGIDSVVSYDSVTYCLTEVIDKISTVLKSVPSCALETDRTFE